MVDLTSTTTRVLPSSNEAGLDLVARHLSAARVEAFRGLGLGLVQGHRDGVRIWDLDGKAYVNCRSSGGVFDFGHRPEFAIRALTHALRDLGDMGDWLVPSAVRAQGAAALARTLPGDLRYTFFTPGGGEAVEVACKLARATTGRTGIVSAEHGYHGHVGFALAMDEERDSRWFAPLVPGITKIPFGDVATVERAVSDETAAVCMETVPATAGYLVPPDDYWPAVREICHERGALLILDEVQAGLGRTGRVWACDRWDVAPDLLVAGKGLSGGVYPIAACSFGDDVDAFTSRRPCLSCHLWSSRPTTSTRSSMCSTARRRGCGPGDRARLVASSGGRGDGRARRAGREPAPAARSRRDHPRGRLAAR
jgi:acetylornithine/succinyldiaminopimelate/putrescine aminotransferase